MARGLRVLLRRAWLDCPLGVLGASVRAIERPLQILNQTRGGAVMTGVAIQISEERGRPAREHDFAPRSDPRLGGAGAMGRQSLLPCAAGPLRASFQTGIKAATVAAKGTALALASACGALRALTLLTRLATSGAAFFEVTHAAKT